MKVFVRKRQNNLLKNVMKLALITIFSFTISLQSKAQEDPGDGSGGNGGAGTDPDVNAPFDGGISILLATGVAYGAKEWFQAKRNARQMETLEG